MGVSYLAPTASSASAAFAVRSAYTFCAAATALPNSNPGSLSDEAGQIGARSRNLLERSDNRDRIHVIEEADMSDAEDLSLHLALSVGDDGGKAALQFFYDDARIDVCRRQNGGRSRCG